MASAVPSIPDIDRVVAGFVHFLRRGGLVITVDQSITLRRALDRTGVGNGLDVYWAGRATLVTRREEIPMYDAMFLAFFHHNSSGFGRRFDDAVETPASADAPGEGEQDGDTGGEIWLRYSALDTLQDKDFAEFTAAEIRESAAVIKRMRLRATTRPSRRRRSARGGDRHDLRTTARLAMRTGGEPIALARTRAGTRTRRVVLLLDVSGSMEAYARVMIRYAHATLVGRRAVEVFALGTRLTRLTRQLDTHDVDEAVANATASVRDWSGGTRLGETISRFNQEWGARGLSRGSVVVVMSDGWDRGSPEVMSEAMARLQRTAHRVLWVNPLKAGAGYEPTALGMAAALPHIDELLEGHSLRSLTALGELLADV